MPQPLINQDKVYSCTLWSVDLEYDNEPVSSECQKVKKCRHCVYFHEQAYTIVITDERFKEFI